MENKSHALIAGIFTLLLLAAAVVIGMWFNRDKVNWVPYEIATKLSVPGLNPQAVVRYRGLDIGRVDDIMFDPRVPGQLLIHFRVKPDTPVTQSTFSMLGYQGVTGIAYIQLDDDGSLPTRVRSDKKNVARIPLRPSLLDKLQNRGLVIMEQSAELTRRFNVLLSADNQKIILDAFNHVSHAAKAVETIPQRLQPTLDQLPQLTAQGKQTLAQVSQLAQQASALGATLNQTAIELSAPNGPIKRISSATEQVGSVADHLEVDVLPLAHDARTTLHSVNRAVDGLNQHPQSILFGKSAATPGPGEPGFSAPSN